ncbi:MAG: ABC transporter permease [Streptococcaceae bacterium]|jgi:ABC-2 type transport system permease protein|nr:ABC transporter permease [Streptococcaceae bacterium]
MNGQTWLVAKNTYRNKVKSFGFWSMVLSPFLMVAIYLVIGLVISSGFSETGKLAVVNNAPVAAVLKADKSVNSTISEVSDIDTAKKQLKDEKIDGYLTESDGRYTIVSSSKTSNKFDQGSFQSALTSVHMRLTAGQLGLSAADLQKLMMPASLKMETLSSSGDNNAGGDSRMAANMAIATITSLFIFIFLMMYSGMVAQEIGNEKSNRIMETLLAATSSNVQYYGKILGVILLALTQLVFYAVAIAVAFPFIKDMAAVKSISSMLSGIDLGFGIYVFFMAFFGILGYLIAASIIASLVNEQAQVQQAVQPLTFFSMIGYIAGIAGAAVPGNIILRVLSYIPFISPTLMSSRYAIQYSSATEAYIALALQIVATLAIAKLGERIYARNVLSYSDDKILSQFFRNLRGESAVRVSSSGGTAAAVEQPQKRKSFLKCQSLGVRILIAIIIVVLVFLFRYIGNR